MAVQSRRAALTLLGSSLLAGCCSLRGFPKPGIGVDPAPPTARADLLAPERINTINVPTDTCIDTHAHFFNASDVTVRGYLEGPVAYSTGGVLGELIKLLAPIADELGEIAPTAKAEFESLRRDQADLSLLGPEERQARFATQRLAERQNISVEVNRLIQSRRGRPFRDAYEKLGTEAAALSSTERRPRINKLDENSVLEAMQAAEASVDPIQLRELATSDRAPYKEGILAFVGYMLSSRHQNLRTYQDKFSKGTNTIGVRRTLGSLVNFDRWLACPPRSAHEDQLKLHAELSRLSDDYMWPLVSYNPWTDVAEGGNGIELVIEAVRNYRAVGVKIYPPNGFLPWGNVDANIPKAPSGAEIDRVLQKFWLTCLDLQVPVLAHAGPSMGKDALHSRLSGPEGWGGLLGAKWWRSADRPRIVLGHFGGDTGGGGVDDWTARFASLMGEPYGKNMYADLGYWEKLQCSDAGSADCKAAQDRLKAVLSLPIAGGEVVADRVMYGSDWLMLSKEKNWPAYANQLHASISSFAPQMVARVFGENAQRCFGQRLNLS
jgi:predicted TIM-barrel fold metal-dependent hydrolase